jgi:hypothetical protein
MGSALRGIGCSYMLPVFVNTLPYELPFGRDCYHPNTGGDRFVGLRRPD